MSTVQLVIVCVTVLLIVVTVCAAPVARRERPASLVGSRVTVHTRRPDDRSLTGIVDQDTASYVRLVDASYVTSAGVQPVPGGVAIIPAQNEAWRQEHEARPMLKEA